jgi:hypothetical protein
MVDDIQECLDTFYNQLWDMVKEMVVDIQVHLDTSCNQLWDMVQDKVQALVNKDKGGNFHYIEEQEPVGK